MRNLGLLIEIATIAPLMTFAGGLPTRPEEPDAAGVAVASQDAAQSGNVCCGVVPSRFRQTRLAQHAPGNVMAPDIAASSARLTQSAPLGMVWVPGGEFVMGNNSAGALRNERPAHRVRVDGFWMDATEVTNAEYCRFVEATGYVTTAEKVPTLEEIMGRAGLARRERKATSPDASRVAARATGEIAF